MFNNLTPPSERKTAVCRLWPGVGISTYDQALLAYDGLNKYLLSAGVFDRKNFFVFAKNYRACVDVSDGDGGVVVGGGW